MAPEAHPSSYAQSGSKPEVRNDKPTLAAAAVHQAAIAPRLTTKVWVYLNHTGNDAGSTSEIKSEIYFDAAHVALGSIEISNNTDFSADNHGLGKLLLYKEAIRRGAGFRFRATGYEEGNISTPNRYFVDGTIDFDSGPDAWSGGQLFTWGPFHNTSDGNYKGYIQFQVVPS